MANETTVKKKREGSGKNCAVIGCKNTSKRLRKWKLATCELHAPETHEFCVCLQPYQMHRFPGGSSAEAIAKRQQWVTNIDRLAFKPAKYSTVCSLHFVEGRPTPTNPYPTINMGYPTNVLADQYRDLKMTGCCVRGCSNRPEKGIKMHKFPKNPYRRKVWEEKVNTTHVDANGKPWYRAPHAQICEVHFRGDQYETHRIDGKRKLKHDAVPTIFGERQITLRRSRVGPIRSILLPELEPRNLVPHDHDYSASAKTSQGMPVVFPGSVPEEYERLQTDDSVAEDDTTFTDFSTTDSTSDNLTKMRKRMKTYQAKIHQLKRENGMLLKKQNRLETSMMKMFEREQIEALSRGSMRGIQWSKETINKAHRLWQVCGSKGYEHLLQQHYPLPSIRTLQRGEDCRASPDLDEVVGTSRATLLPPEMFGSGFHN